MIYDISERRTTRTLSQAEVGAIPLATIEEILGLVGGTTLAITSAIFLKEGALKSFLIGAGGSMAGSAVFAAIKRKTSRTA